MQKINAVMVTLRSIHDPSIAPLAAASGALRVRLAVLSAIPVYTYLYIKPNQLLIFINN